MPKAKETEIPEELEQVWDDSIAQAFAALKPKQQDFLLHFLRCGNASEAYRKAYNPVAKDHLAHCAGSQALGSIGVRAVLDKFNDQKALALFTVSKTYFDMTQAVKPEWEKDGDGQYENVGDVPDWMARDKGAAGLCKIYGLNAPEKVEDDRFTELLKVIRKEKSDG